MVINNNLAAMQILHKLQRNTNALTSAAKKLSTGEKINSAGDGASEYSIASKMKVNLRSLDECTSNTKNFRDMTDLASAAVDQQVNIMKQIHTVALRASDDAYTDEDRKNLQKEISGLLDESEDIAQSTTYNGIPLLHQSTRSRTDMGFNANAPYRANPANRPMIPEAVSGDYLVPDGSYVTITTSPPNTYNPTSYTAGTILSIMPVANDVIYDTATSTIGLVTVDTTSGGVYFNTTSGTKTLIQASTLSNYASVAYPANTAAPSVGTTVATSATPSFSTNAANTPVTITDTTTKSTVTNAAGSGLLSYIRYGTGESIYPMDFSTIIAACSNLPGDLNGLGFSLTCSGCSQYVSVQFDSSTDSSSYYVGTNSPNNPKPLCYVIGTSNVTDAKSLMETIFNGITAKSEVRGGGTLPSSTDTTTTLTDIHNIQLKYYAATGEVTLTKGPGAPRMTLKNGVIGEITKTNFYKPEQNCRLQGATTGSQNTNMKFPNTTLSILFPDALTHWDIDPSSADYPTEWPKGYDSLSDVEKKKKWLNEVWPYPDQRVHLDTSDCVSTRQKANAFLDQVDQALKYLLASNTTLGAESARLDYTEANLITSAAQTTSSVSTIQDTDMAATMTEYTKQNVLAQAAQSMLAQANQAGSDILNLLK